MEEKQQISVLTFSLQIWTEVLVVLYNSIAGQGSKAKKEYREVLNSFFALKTASRQLNQQFDDQFFYHSIFGRNLKNLRTVYLRTRIQNIIKYGKYTDLEALLQLKLEKAWRAYSIVNAILSESLPFVAQHADPAFMNSYLCVTHDGFDGFSLHSIITALRRANERKDNNEMSILLLPKLLKFCDDDTDEAGQKKIELMEALKSGTKLNFENVVGFDVRFKEEPTVGLLSALIGSYKPVYKQLIVPDGTMFHAYSLGTKNDYNKGLSNLYLLKGSETSDIIYRSPLDSSRHKISVQKKNVKGKSPIYIYDGFETDNECKLVLKTSLYEKVFGMMYMQQFVMVTYEALKLPLEEQPWFLGIISDAEKNALLNSSPNAFFTYGFLGKVYFAIKGDQQKAINNLIYSEGQIEAKIPKNKLMLGIYNNGKPKDLELHLAFKYILQGNFELTKQHIIENKVDVQTAFKDSEILRMHLETSKTTVNNELIVWLIEKGVPVERSNFHSSKTLTYAIHRCNEKALRAIIQHSKCYPDILEALCDRGVSYELLKFAYSKTDIQIDGFMSTFLTAVKLNKMPQQYAIRTFIMLAWQFGNSENYFKMLPIEIMHHILSFEDIDEPAYFPFLEYLFSLKKKPMIETNIYSWSRGELIPFLPFFWRHWGQLFTAVTATYVARAISEDPLINDEVYGPKLRYWFTKIVTSEKFTHEFSIDIDGLSLLTLYCLKTPTEEAVSMLKFLLDRKLIAREELLSIRQLQPHLNLLGPATWHAVLSGSIPTVKYLLDENMLFEYDARGHPKSLSELFTQIPNLQKVKEFIQQYRANK